MSAIRPALTILAALFLCIGGSAALAAQADQSKKEQPAAQAEEAAKANADKEKAQQDDKQPQPANVPVIKQDEGC